jgi:very-short-patch-repair endonuclease
MTDAERLLWRRLCRRQVHGLRFRRQHPFAGFILDFYCVEIGVAIELDGGQHADSSRDEWRDSILTRRGLCVLRYWNDDVMLRTDDVLADIAIRCGLRRPHPGLPP